jgi:hypothetical protein
MTALPVRCPVRGCGAWTDATEHWPFCPEHYWQLPRRQRYELWQLVAYCYEEAGSVAVQTALLRAVDESVRFLESLPSRPSA